MGKHYGSRRRCQDTHTTRSGLVRKCSAVLNGPEGTHKGQHQWLRHGEVVYWPNDNETPEDLNRRYQ